MQMKSKLKFTGLLSLILIGFSILRVDAQIQFTEVTSAADWADLTEKAQNAGKLIFLDVYATWCGPCKYLEKNVYTNPDLGTYFNEKYINAKMDGETDFGSVFAREHQLEAYPTMYFLTGNASLIAKIVGVREAGPLQDIGKTVVENADNMAYYAENFPKKSLSLEELQNYQAILTTLGQKDKAAEVGAAILPSLTEEDILNPAYKDIVLAASPDLDSKVFNVLKSNKARLEESWSKEELNQLFGTIFNRTLSEAISSRNTALRDRIISELLPVYMDNQKDIDAGAFITRKIYFANTDQWKAYGDLVNQVYEESHNGDDTWLYSEAYEIANNYGYSEDAMNYSLTLVNRALELKRSFDNVVLAAYIQGIKGSFQEANKLLEEAGAMTLTDDQKNMLSELKKIIDQAESQQKEEK
jgi:thiol-disulfide isomerase/thioredoxin